MSESLPLHPEQREIALNHERYEALALPTAEQAEPLRQNEKDPVLALAEARATIAETAHEDASQAVAESLKAAESTTAAPTPTAISRDLKNITLKREMNSIQRQENLPQRTLSKVIHQPVIRAVSEAASNSVSRPSGILGGGIVAFIGTSAYLYLAKHLGFEYNFVVFLVLFAGGFIVGLVLELLVHMASVSRRKAIDL